MQKLKKIPVKTKAGTFALEFSAKGLYAVKFPRRCPPLIPGIQVRIPGIRRVDMSGYTPFQQRIYRALIKVPAGKTVTYEELARKAGRPKACRAVGSAMRKNRLPIVIPCHRVVCSSGKLGEYSAGQTWKRFLLRLESAI